MTDIDLQRKTALAERAENVIKSATKMIWVTFAFEGIHSYPDAVGRGKGLYDVDFLQYPHRHIFHIKVWIQVFDDDRDIEFIQFKRWCMKQFEGDRTVMLNNKSCEMIANDLYRNIAIEFPNRDVWVEVSEDNENGTLIKYK